ncbi:MAG: ABC transporter ATP-binding protein [Nitrospirae bacterium]|nr:ABC transporter ATP-binding protein [Nitrospirota bacterium]
MSDVVISVENLYKEYRLGTISHGTLHRDLQSWWARMRGKEDPNSIISAVQPSIHNVRASGNNPHMLALNDVSFEVKKGDVLGIIGRNGAGKSTLLKILSEVTSPTKGQVKIKGRVASLLEVGTGFHPELTGRENIYLNGAILGMKRKEIGIKFDEIVAFAEIEKFIDTPVKRYSSGMYVRLAFAVAAHLDPEILIIDEVLAVGDAQFQKKCLGKMGDVAAGGRTVLFVSHNMGAIEQLCSSALLLAKGCIAKAGSDVRSIISEYSFSTNSTDFAPVWENSGADYDNNYFVPMKLFFSDCRGNEIITMPCRNDEDLWINIVGNVKQLDPALYIGIGVFNDMEVYLFGSAFVDGHPDTWPRVSLGENVMRCRLPKHTLNEGIYKIEMHGSLLRKKVLFVPGMNNPKIFLEIKGGLSESPLWLDKRMGFFAPVLEWTN